VSVYVRYGTHWFKNQELRPGDQAVFDDFGLKVAMSGESVIVARGTYDHGYTGAFVFAPAGALAVPTKLFHYDHNTLWARTAQLDEPNDYETLQDYPVGFGQWSHVAASPTGVVFFYNSQTGAAAAGKIDLYGIFTTTRYWPPGTSFGPGWTHIVWHGDNLFFYCSGNGLAAVGRLEGPYLDFHQYNTFRYLITGWTHVASVQGLLLFYKQSNGIGYACQFVPVYNSAGALTRINFQYVRVQVFAAGYSHIVQTAEGVLLYSLATGVYRIGNFDDSANFVERTASWPEWSAYPLWDYTPQRAGWTHIVVSGERLLFYDANTGEGMTGYVNDSVTSDNLCAEPLAYSQYYPAGSLSYPGARRWSHVVPVAAQ
jgi:hypothetical protein